MKGISRWERKRMKLVGSEHNGEWCQVSTWRQNTIWWCRKNICTYKGWTVTLFIPVCCSLELLNLGQHVYTLITFSLLSTQNTNYMQMIPWNIFPFKYLFCGITFTHFFLYNLTYKYKVNTRFSLYTKFHSNHAIF